MKIAIRCLNCQTITRLNETYQVRVREIIANPLTGEKREALLEGRMCRSCARNAGYKVRKEGDKNEAKLLQG